MSLRKAIFGIGAVFKSVFIGVKTIVKGFINTFKTLWKLIKEFSEKGIKGSFGDVLEQGFEDGKQIAIDGANEIGEAFTDGFEDALGSRLEKKTVDQLNTSMSNAFESVQGKVKGMFDDFMGGFGLSTAGGGGGNGGGDDTTTSGGGGDEEKDNLDKTIEKVSIFKQLLEATGQSAAVVGEGIKGAFLNAFEGMMEGENVFKQLIKGLVALIKKLIAAALAAFVLSTLVKAIFPGMGKDNPMSALKDFKGLFTSFTGIEMAKGGIVSTPTLATVGEYAGARQNPEVIAPLDKLKNLIGESGGGSRVQVGGQFTLKGQDLVVALQRADRNRNRIK